MLNYPELDWMELLSLLMSDLVFRAGQGASGPQNAQRWRDTFARLKPDVKWGKQEEDEGWKESYSTVAVRLFRLLKKLRTSVKLKDENSQLDN